MILKLLVIFLIFFFTTVASELAKNLVGTFITLAPSFINRAGISSKPVLVLALREHNSLKTNSSVTGCKTSFLSI
jgi:hypothetical protein